MLANGVDLPTVSRRLGYTKPSTMLDIHDHAVPGLHEKAAAIMDKITTPITIKILQTAPGLATCNRKNTGTVDFLDILPPKKIQSSHHAPVAQWIDSLASNWTGRPKIL